ncbi:hypothetical protein [Tabrizicola sp.]|jgi:hypothetical protein|uniref:hypothetical protein n=1 Tax=Tabrizicola sp. TaxID=2005166 RepID=UPI0035B0EBB8
MDDFEISVTEAAARLGKNKQHVFKVLKRLGITAALQRSSDARGQKVAVIRRADFETLKENFQTAFVGNGGPTNGGPTVDSSTTGFFYLIQLEPEHDPGRFKLGFASSLDERMRAHRTAAPLAKLVKAWPCKLLWEKTAIESISYGFERLHTEVFRAAHINDVLRKCERFFDVMPREI